LRLRRAARAGCAALCLLLPAGCAVPAEGPTLDLPPRPSNAPGGAAIAEALRDVDFSIREQTIYNEVARGNVPAWLRRLSPVQVTGAVEGGDVRTVTFWVTPDYLAVGSDDDFFFIPVSTGLAQRIADLAGASLPTPAMVDATWAAARVRLNPIRIRPDEFTRSFHYFERHNSLVQAQRRLQRAPPGTFVAGHKLDVVYAGPDDGEGEFGVYGWHHLNGAPIQPLHMMGADREPLFSAGLRLAHQSVMVDGVEHGLRGALRDTALAPLLHRREP
jgi:hypothetical protein